MFRRSARQREDAPTTLRGNLEPVVIPPPDHAEPRPRLSVLRMLTAAIILGGGCYAGVVGLGSALRSKAATERAAWFAPYVDVTLTPTDQFQLASADPARQSVLGFIVAAGPNSCQPSWGAAYSLSSANQSLALTSRLVQMERDGAQPVVSFGGAKNTSLAVACKSPGALAHAYESVINAYGLHVIDLDIEGPALNSYAAERRRAEAVRLVEQAAARHHRPLEVWLTLPVEPSGLQGNALSVIASMLRDHVRIAGINIMAMDFSRAPGAGQTMASLAEQALNASATQLSHLLPRYGVRMSPAGIWHHLGVTVMIGQNDFVGQRFGVADALALRSFVSTHGIARISIWSLNRDQPCGSNFRIDVLSNTCSGTRQSSLQFTHLFGHLTGFAQVANGQKAPVLQAPSSVTRAANAPFPLWNGTASYSAGYKIVRQGQIYEAKWYVSPGEDPAAQYQYSWQSPWQLLGPVLRSDHPPYIPKPPAGSHRTWSEATAYAAGAEVLYKSLPYRAKWANQGSPPGPVGSQSASSPWLPLYRVPGEPAPS
jgi:chitinase